MPPAGSMAPVIPISSALKALIDSALKESMGVALRTVGLAKGTMAVVDPTAPLVKALTAVRPVDHRFRFTCNTRIANRIQANLLCAACIHLLCRSMVF